MMQNRDYDLEYLRIGAGEIEDYLLSKELFWPVTGRPSSGRPFFLKMTVGNLLLSQHRLATLSAETLLTASEEREFLGIQRRFEAVRAKWQVAWEDKAGQEYQTRFNQWMRALEELKGDRYQNAPYYRNEIRVRVLLELLADQIRPEDRRDLLPFDTMLRRMLKRGEFLWQEELQPGFPEEKFWYLYGEI